MRRSRRPRDSIVLATKVCGFNERFDWFRGALTRINKAQLEASNDASSEASTAEQLVLSRWTRWAR